jgi:FKBP-type peptidyl-prolyl cis-trans isomerase
LVLLLVLFQCRHTQKTTQGNLPGQTATPSGLIYETIKPGKGDFVKEGDEIFIHETTSYLSGKLLFSSREAMPEPLKFRVGSKMVIAGVEEGVLGMRVGEVRKMIIPPALSKRTMYPDFLSPDSTLLYEVEVIDIVKTN